MRLIKRRKNLFAVGAAFCIYGVIPHNFLIKKQYPVVNTANKTIDSAIAEYEKEHGKTPESTKLQVLDYYFTKEAFEKLKDIPICEGKLFGEARGIATGRNLVMNYCQNLAGYGFGMKTVIKEELSLKNQTIIHENIHHASALGLIDDVEFDNAWQELSRDPFFKPVTKQIDEHIQEHYSGVMMALFPNYRTLEREAFFSEVYTLQFLRQFMPQRIKDVYKRTLK